MLEITQFYTGFSGRRKVLRARSTSMLRQLQSGQHTREYLQLNEIVFHLM